MPRHQMSDAQFEATRDLILENTGRLVAEVGLRGLSMRVIGKSVSLTPAALYRYFPSKDELIWEYSRRAIGELNAALLAVKEHDSPPLEAIASALSVYARFALADTDRFRTVFMEHDPSGYMRAMESAEMTAPLTILREFVRAAMISGDLEAHLETEGDTALAHALWAAVHGAVVLHLTMAELGSGALFETIAHIERAFLPNRTSRATGSGTVSTSDALA